MAQGLGFASYSARIAANGATVRSLGVQASSNPTAGKYIVEFTRPVGACISVASPYGRAGGQASVAPVSGQSRKIEVSTFNKSGVAANNAFTLLVSCPAYSEPVAE
jgi:hypothetical protein